MDLVSSNRRILAGLGLKVYRLTMADGQGTTLIEAKYPSASGTHEVYAAVFLAEQLCAAVPEQEAAAVALDADDLLIALEKSERVGEGGQRGGRSGGRSARRAKRGPRWPGPGRTRARERVQPNNIWVELLEIRTLSPLTATSRSPLARATLGPPLDERRTVAPGPAPVLSPTRGTAEPRHLTVTPVLSRLLALSLFLSRSPSLSRSSLSGR